MRIYQVPIEHTITEADPNVSDSYRRVALHCSTVVERWEVVAELKSEHAKGIAQGAVLGMLYVLALMALL